MKFVTILIDGMADEVIESLGNKTPLEYADIKTINEMAKVSKLGMVHTVPDGMPPGSDVANLSVMGYEPEIYHTGRSPLEAISVGLNLEKEDVTFRCNLVTISEEKEFLERKMIDHSSSDISSEEAKILIDVLKSEFQNEFIEYHCGVSYRNIILWKHGSTNVNLVPPHDFLERKISDYLPSGDNADKILEMTKRSFNILNNHPINIKRKELGLNPANSIWIWGEGKKPILDDFEKKYGVKGSVISAVDLIKGIAIAAGLESIDVEGATGTIHSNFDNKAIACIESLKSGKDYVYLHLEAPDECSHQGNLEEKIKSIEIIDKKIVKYIKENLEIMNEEFKIMILPDHPTPVRLRTHTSESVPFMIYDSRKKENHEFDSYNEISCEKSKLKFETGQKLAKSFLTK